MSAQEMESQANIHFEEHSKLLADGMKILQQYSWLLDSFVLDFYTDKHWEKLPSLWRNILEEVDLVELGSILDYRLVNQGLKRVWPLSLLALRSASHQLSLSRRQNQCFSSCEIEASSEIYKNLKSSVHYCENIVESTSAQDSSKKVILENEILTNPQFSHVFTKHVKPKKRHEIALMAKITAESAKLNHCQYVVDVGSGLGHLARTLAYGYGLNVCCLEAQDSLAVHARKLDLELELTVNKYTSEKTQQKYCRPVHLNKTLNLSVDENDFVKALKTAFGIDDKDFSFGLVGLHPCGDLGPILLRLLTKCSEAKFINIVGCCYMKLSTQDQRVSRKFQGYPLSDFILQQPHVLSYEAREIACHAIENYSERLCSGNVSSLKVHCYRATLEKILVKYWPDLKHSGIRSIRHASSLPFEGYCKAATERLGVVVPEEDINSEETKEDLSHWKRVVIFYSLRLLLAPLVETILLWDRLCYVLEMGLNGLLMPVFNPCLSPRNHILIATKQTEKQ